MRCLCLAEAMRYAGHTCWFVCRARRGDLIEVIEERGFGCTTLPETEDGEVAASWLGATMDDEIAQSSAAVEYLAPDWLIVDHYALDASWERAVAPDCTQVMVIDDLADRPHACDFLLDQGLANTPAEYAALTPVRARMLLGPAYALLRPEFGKLRKAAAGRNPVWPPARILVNLGGVDPDNATQDVLEALARSELPSRCRIDVVMGGNSPHINAVRTCAAASRFDVGVAVDVADMGSRMLAADLAIGAAGTTAWERACMGLPSLLISIAENQLGVAAALNKAGAALDLGAQWKAGWQDRLMGRLAAVSAPDRLAEMSEACSALVDGAGTARVVNALTAPGLSLRPCRLDDAEKVWLWREADGAARFYRSGAPTPWETHKNWFEAALRDTRYALFMVEENGHSVAHLRFDLPDSGVPEIGLAIETGRKHTGLGLRTVAQAVSHARAMTWPGLSAEVHEANVASARVFERNGFDRVRRNGAFVQYKIELSKGELG